MNLLDIDIYRRARRRYGPRRFQAYTIAAGKSGTHSVANMFSHCYRAAHEPEAADIIATTMRRMGGEMDDAAMAAWLENRDRRLGLEMDSSGVNSIIAADLVRQFPKAHFIITMRDCFSWANSWFNQMLNNPSPSPHWQTWREALHGTRESCSFTPAEAALEAAGTWSLDRVFQGWVRMYRSGLEAAPSDRTLRIHTHRLRSDADRLANFLGVPLASIDTDRSHAYRAPKNRNLLHAIDPAYVNELAQEMCGDIMREFYPDLPCELGIDYRV